MLFFHYLFLLRQLQLNSLNMRLQKYREIQKQVKNVLSEEFQSSFSKVAFDLMDLISIRI